MSVKGSGNTLELNPKRERTLLFFVIFSWDMHRIPKTNPNNKVDI
jgi:hypothetical protein